MPSMLSSTVLWGWLWDIVGVGYGADLAFARAGYVRGRFWLRRLAGRVMVQVFGKVLAGGARLVG